MSPLAIILSLCLAQAAEPVEFDRAVAPLLLDHCYDCHSGPRPKGGLDVSRSASLLKGGKSGPGLDLLWQRVAADEMPPKHPLSAGQKETLKKWIAAGAKWGSNEILDPFQVTTTKRAGVDWWALQPIRKPESPAMKVDDFILAKLEAKGLKPSPEADRRTLIRRVTFDLLGLPPTWEEVEAFVNSKESDAYDKLVDRLLDSPHYGERWARHWLDIVRYGESGGFERNGPRPDAWPYRDWVVAALNRDLPFDEFCRLQLAGDVLYPKDPEARKATGYLVAGIHNNVLPNLQRLKDAAFQDELEELTGNVGQTFLGLTVQCARCHDHKFDPVSQADYYRFAANLTGIRHVDKNPQFPKMYGPMFAQPAPSRILNRGVVTEPGAEVTPAGLRAFGLSAEFDLPANAPEASRRKRLAIWMTGLDNPLFPRVLVNRLWHYHFGIGLVDTPSDFGFNGGRPSHPELLDWLAFEFREGGFRLKPLHRLLVTSNAYRQASAPRPEALKMDADNRLVWRHRPLPMQGEVLRDTMLSVAGLLNPKVGGAPFNDYKESSGAGTTFYEPFDPVGPDFHRRSLYRFQPRGANANLLDVFDCPDPAASTPRRNATTTPLQALSLWNGPFALRMCETLAKRVEKEAPANRVRRAWELVLQRAPTAVEESAAEVLVREHGLQALARALFNANEFLLME